MPEICRCFVENRQHADHAAQLAVGHEGMHPLSERQAVDHRVRLIQHHQHQQVVEISRFLAREIDAPFRHTPASTSIFWPTIS